MNSEQEFAISRHFLGKKVAFPSPFLFLALFLWQQLTVTAPIATGIYIWEPNVKEGRKKCEGGQETNVPLVG